MGEKLYFKIGDVAARYNVNPSLIRYWEQEFEIIKPKKTARGTRLFTRKDVDNFEIIYHLVKEKGMTIQGAKSYMAKRRKQDSIDRLEVINTLKRTREMLVEVKNLMGTSPKSK
jgi:DNA-binding transcriptional MerR regulator